MEDHLYTLCLIRHHTIALAKNLAPLCLEATHLHSRVANMPFRLSIERSTPYPKHPITIGDHLLKKRLENGLFQKDVTRSIRVAIYTIIGWEKDRSTPEVRYYPAIIAFLGYDPLPEPETLGEKIEAWRRRNGITRKALAKQLRIDEAALKKREKDIASKSEQKAIELTRSLEEQFGGVSAYRAETDIE